MSLAEQLARSNGLFNGGRQTGQPLQVPCARNSSAYSNYWSSSLVSAPLYPKQARRRFAASTSTASTIGFTSAHAATGWNCCQSGIRAVAAARPSSGAVPNPSIERTSYSRLRLLPLAAHVKR